MARRLGLAGCGAILRATCVFRPGSGRPVKSHQVLDRLELPHVETGDLLGAPSNADLEAHVLGLTRLISEQEDVLVLQEVYALVHAAK